MQTFIQICWGTVITVWVIGAIYGAIKAPAVQVRKGISVTWPLALLFYVILRFVVPLSWLKALVWTDPEPWILALGGVLLGVSTLFTLFARLSLGTMWSLEPAARADHELRTTGAYRFTRHPIYTGIIGMGVGSAWCLGWGAALLAGILIVGTFKLKIRVEEGLLRQTFGVAYDDYAERVPQLVPFWHPSHRP